jgi:predicted aldo/keto reductase-like oxidoreductase
MLTAFNRDHIDMVRNLIWDKTGSYWGNWEKLFALRDKGKVRAVGVSVHAVGIGINSQDGSALQDDIKDVLEAYPDELDYVIFPYNFYHNIGYPYEWYPEGFIPLAQTLREKGIGIVTMKPFAGEYFTVTLNQAAKAINPDLSFSNAALRYILNSGLEPDMTLVGMNTMSELKENFNAFYKPAISADEEKFLEDIRGVASKVANKILPDHYKFLQSWAPETYKSTSYQTV